MKRRNLALLGGPGSGKSTWLGALADALESGGTPGLELAALPDDAGIIDVLADPLREGRYPQRTPTDTRIPLTVHLAAQHGVSAPTEFILRTGDLAGEDVDRVFQDRLWSQDWERWTEADAILLFVRPDGAIGLPTWIHTDDAGDGWAAMRGDAKPPLPREPGPDDVFGPGLPEEVPPTPRARLTDPQKVPTALSVVELLQILRASHGLPPGLRRPGSLRIAMVVSAWDAVSAEWQEQGPGAWLAHTVPLLEDYLWSNFAPEDVRRFGLSATGGDLNRPADRERFLDDPQGYVDWVDLGRITRTPDISLPLRWVLFGDPALPQE